MAKIIFLIGFGMVTTGCAWHTDYHHTFQDTFAPKYRIIDHHIHTVPTP
jgi:hypothetical protein